MMKRNSGLRQIQRRLVSAIVDGDVSSVKQILEERRAASEKFPLDDHFIAESSISKPQTYLQYAVQACNLEIIGLFLDEGASPDSTNRVGETALHVACDYSPSDSLSALKEKVVKYLLRRGADINLPTDHGCTALMKVCAAHNARLVKILLGAEANPDYLDYNGNSALHLTLLSSGSAADISAVVDLLARHGCQVNQHNKKKMTPVMLAAQSGWTGVVQTLLLAGCEVDSVDGEQCTSLSLSVQYRHTNCVRLLLQNGADPSRSNYRRITPLLFAVIEEDEATIEVILSTPQSRSTIDIPDCEGTTPILHAVKLAAPDYGLQCTGGRITCMLVQHECDINTQQYNSGDTPLILASRAANIELVGYLLKNGAMVNMVDQCGESCLHSTIDSVSHADSDRLVLAILNLLITAGCEVNIRNHSGLTALHKAAYKGCSLNIVRFLIDAGTDLDSISRDANRYSPLQSAISSQSKDTALLLIERGCDINRQSAAGETALALAIRLDSHDVIRQLMSMESCDINAGGRNPPLHVATYMGKELLVRQLLQLGADINKKDSRGNTPVQIAIEGHHNRIVKTLLTTGCCFEYHGLSTISPLALLRGSITPPDRQPLFLAIQHDDMELFKALLSRYHRKPYQLLKTLHDMLTIDNELAERGVQMVSRESRRELLSLLRDELSTPASLIEMCRGELRKTLGGRRMDIEVQTLPIPVPLKHYLLFDTDRHLDLSDLNDKLSW